MFFSKLFWGAIAPFSLLIFATKSHLLRYAIDQLYNLIIGLKFERSLGLVTHLRALSEYDIDTDTGFFPRKPLEQLDVQHPEFGRWEKALSIAPEVLSLGTDFSPEEGQEWRETIRSWPILSVDRLKSDRLLLQRAHVVLTFLVQFYVHSIPSDQDSSADQCAHVAIPAALAVPLVEVSIALGTAPVLTFADTIFWNWDMDTKRRIEPLAVPTINNIRFANSFSSTADEANFYAISAACELHGAKILHLVETCTRNPEDISVLSTCFEGLADIIGELTEILRSVREQVKPNVFFASLRPWFEGSDTDRQWIYEGVKPSDLEVCKDCSGPSGGQSPIIHVLDIFLGVNHQHRHQYSYQQTRKCPLYLVTNRSKENRLHLDFMQRMRRYMPENHRQYLEDLEGASQLVLMRQTVEQAPELRVSNNRALLALKRFRDMHIRIACRYILAGNNRRKSDHTELAKGTGGNELSSLLKDCRDSTVRAMIEE